MEGVSAPYCVIQWAELGALGLTRNLLRHDEKLLANISRDSIIFQKGTTQQKSWPDKSLRKNVKSRLHFYWLPRTHWREEEKKSRALWNLVIFTRPRVCLVYALEGSHMLDLNNELACLLAPTFIYITIFFLFFFLVFSHWCVCAILSNYPRETLLYVLCGLEGAILCWRLVPVSLNIYLPQLLWPGPLSLCVLPQQQQQPNGPCDLKDLIFCHNRLSGCRYLGGGCHTI